MILMLNWISVADSTRVRAVAYDADEGVIYARFHDGAEYAYSQCSREEWNGFITPGVSKGQYINSILNHHPYRRL
jgi:hypothetical protein